MLAARVQWGPCGQAVPHRPDAGLAPLTKAQSPALIGEAAGDPALRAPSPESLPR